VIAPTSMCIAPMSTVRMVAAATMTADALEFVARDTIVADPGPTQSVMTVVVVFSPFDRKHGTARFIRIRLAERRFCPGEFHGDTFRRAAAMTVKSYLAMQGTDVVCYGAATTTTVFKRLPRTSPIIGLEYF
jgi:hypothetical protein